MIGIGFIVGAILWLLRPEPALLIPTTLDTTYGLGEVVPEFEFTTLDGVTRQLSQYGNGSPVLLVLRDGASP